MVEDVRITMKRLYSYTMDIDILNKCKQDVEGYVKMKWRFVLNQHRQSALQRYKLAQAEWIQRGDPSHFTHLAADRV
uniref:HTH myb-type domain-containing protein n=1 Tax=Angiostrongylus cantonensis TaxID=6313 RepID=A0A0K0CUI9_ANGCA